HTGSHAPQSMHSSTRMNASIAEHVNQCVQLKPSTTKMTCQRNGKATTRQMSSSLMISDRQVAPTHWDHNRLTIPWWPPSHLHPLMPNQRHGDNTPRGQHDIISL